ncbi:MAG: anhydro-N-acetylmuramic acid kinase [Chloroflexi bacterium]|nr:anhydro-N-acetylmuramic acid kinase [Chloroflexota bacterium]MCL5075976.1 anhydro-N-acetylmuramic acid kinase [Chloroflexota bacterium]
MYDPSEPRLAIGLMAGTSCDGISAALIRTRGCRTAREVTLLAHEVMPFPAEVRQRIFAIYPPNTFGGEELCRLSVLLGELFAEAALRVMAKAGVERSEVKVISSQGVTIYHDPPGPSNNGQGEHVEIAEPAVIADRTGVITVADLRPSDMAAGGHGAPLSVYVDYALFRHPTLSRAIQNIGGIANVTPLRAGAEMDELMSFDTGPGNMVIDAMVRFVTQGAQTFDEDGRMATQGEVQRGLLQALMAHPYLQKAPPKTTGREDFGEHFARQVLAQAQELHLNAYDLVRTVTAFTVETIAYHYERFIYPQFSLDEVILGGGGAHNITLVQMLAERLSPVRIRRHEDYGLSGDAREAITWAILADETLLGNPANVPHASGARHKVLLGKVVFPPPR